MAGKVSLIFGLAEVPIKSEAKFDMSEIFLAEVLSFNSTMNERINTGPALDRFI